MNSENRSDSSYWFFVQPQLMVWVLLTYSIGIGLVHYLGGDLDWATILLGALLGPLLLAGRNYLLAYFDHPKSQTCGLHADDPRYERLNLLERQTLLIIALTILTTGALVTVLLIFRHALNLSALMMLGIALLLAYFSAVPPVQLERKGYGEIAESIIVANLIPAIGFLLLEPEIQTLLVMLTLPLTFLYLALRIVLSLENYAFDRTHRMQTLVIRLDWQKAMTAHNYFILLAFLCVVIFAVFGQPWSITWPMLLTLLIGGWQIIQILGIMAGKPPRWKMLKLTAIGTFVVMAYLVSFSLWIS